MSLVLMPARPSDKMWLSCNAAVLSQGERAADRSGRVQARLEHNHRVRMASVASEGRRARFLLNHIEVLLPFITPQAAAHIR